LRDALRRHVQADITPGAGRMTLANDMLTEPLGGLPRDVWLGRIEEIAEDDGYFEPVGAHHSAIFIDRSPTVLVVSFEELDQVRLANPNGHPVGFRLAARRGWSHLCILAHGETWFRDPSLYGYFDRLVDDGLFEDFDRVVFYGADMGGYGACAYSVAAPGATVVAVQPVATLAARRTSWDPRWRDRRRLDFESRYGYAPAMLEAARAAYIVYDPHEQLDAMHAALFDREPAQTLPCPYLGGRIEADFEHMGILQELLELAGDGRLDRAAFYRLYRRRRDSASYLRRLLDALETADRPYLAALLCRNAVERLNRRRFNEGLNAARAKLAERGITLDGPRVAAAT
jgi:hypothetical protein